MFSLTSVLIFWSAYASIALIISYFVSQQLPRDGKWYFLAMTYFWLLVTIIIWPISTIQILVNEIHKKKLIKRNKELFALWWRWMKYYEENKEKNE